MLKEYGLGPKESVLALRHLNGIIKMLSILANGQPDNYRGKEPFAEMKLFTDSGLWNDNSDQKLSFICEYTLNFE